ncbi:hypothetical protein CC1G_03324 [Coprinopsis cinerea okayama7|uniref:Uncharacterized protein n=1 Tax=Coprinopsis cinerea (strain Okayama-7 / 130 / ATCC MYA-4618 / FGSC 9003) TaxID=240176 RepID=A8N7I1_COPC7|nr:hypothetical protein CC1G_03324 [Coprinopsis cinerea okayama7\|eukprot:XP_001830787.1 hypothetical protein CC1G_03324 [Coprinopsis cinerea okayama7\
MTLGTTPTRSTSNSDAITDLEEQQPSLCLEWLLSWSQYLDTHQSDGDSDSDNLTQTTSASSTTSLQGDPPASTAPSQETTASSAVGSNEPEIPVPDPRGGDLVIYGPDQNLYDDPTTAARDLVSKIRSLNPAMVLLAWKLKDIKCDTVSKTSSRKACCYAIQFTSSQTAREFVLAMNGLEKTSDSEGKLAYIPYDVRIERDGSVHYMIPVTD